ncbi:BTB/POZ protein [Rhizophagus irregularis DAOM 181602=DAOM 197198]|nr:BTB/POZ protein [Rhizophagus irregularis DAOM 181602=DAOM 197198]
MSKQFFSGLSQNYIEILEDDEYYDVTIEVEIFQIILKYIYGGVISLNEQEPSEILKVLDNFKEPILSHVNDASRAVYYRNNFGPTFGGGDIEICADIDNKEYDWCICIRQSYEKKMRDTGDLFLIEDYEMFQIIKKND